MYQRILLPIDLVDPDLARPAIEDAVTMAKASPGSVIRLVHIIPVMPAMLTEYVSPDFDARQREVSLEALEALAKTIGIEAGRTSTTVRQGTVHQQILEEATDFDADLIVMSSHRVGMRTYFLGSQAAHVVRHAACSVLVVRR